MEPVSHPEWASPLVVGEHAREFLPALPKNPTKEALSSLSRDHGMLSLLERHPLSRVELSGRLPQSWNGQYDRLSRDLTVDAFRSPTTQIHSTAPISVSRQFRDCCRFEDSPADKDPEGYDMVEAILRLVGKK